MTIAEFSDLSVQPTHSAPQPDSLFACFDADGRILLFAQEDGALCLPTVSQARPLLPEGMPLFELAAADGRSIFSPPPFEAYSVTEGSGLAYHDLHVFRSMPYSSASVVIACWHLWSWYRRSRFCGSCGHAMQVDGSERAVRCPACGQVSYPTIAPAVIVAITKGDRILLVKNRRSAYKHYALVSGYVEVGETLEHAVRREVLEEVGLHLGALRYLGDQPWGVSGSQMFAFHAEAIGDEPIVMQESELSSAKWFARAEIAPREHVVSIAMALIERFRTQTL